MRPTHLKNLTLSTLCVLASCGGGGGGGNGGGGGQPAAQIHFPPEASLTDAEGITVRGTVARPGKVAGLTVAGVPAFTSDGWKTWTVEVPLEIGQNELEAKMSGSGGGPVGQPDDVTVHRQDVVLGDSGGLAMGDPADGKAWWLDADLGRLIEIDLATGQRTATQIVQGHDFSGGLESPGEPVFDGTRNQVYVVDGSRIHRINVLGGFRSQVCDAGNLSFILDVDYDSVSDRIISLENFNPLGGGTRQVYSIHPETGARELVCSFAPDGLDGDIPAHSLSVFRDGSGSSAFMVSQSGVSLLTFQNGARTPLPSGFWAIQDVACWNFKVFITDQHRGVFEFNLWNGEYTSVYDDPSFSAGRASLCGGPGPNDLALVSDGLDAAYLVDTQTGQAEVICSSSQGEGWNLYSASDLVRFKGMDLVIDAHDGWILKVDAQGGRALFAQGGFIKSPEAAVVIGDYLYVGNSGNGLIVRVDAQGGQELALPANDDLQGLSDLAYWAPAGGAGGRLLALCRKKLVEVDLESSTTSLITEVGDGRGSDFDFAQQLVPHPELEIATFTAAGKASDGEGSVFMVFLDGGMRVMIAGEDPIGGAMGSGAEVSSPRGMAYGTDSTELMIAAGPQGPGSMSLYRLHVASLQRSEISSADRGRGPLLDVPGTVRREAKSGNLYVTGRTEGAVLVIDPESGDRVMTSR